MSDPRSVILVAVVMTGVFTVIGDLATGKKPTIRIGVGVLFAAVMLSALSEVAPQLAKALAYLLVLSALMVHGTAVYSAVSGATAAPKGT